MNIFPLTGGCSEGLDTFRFFFINSRQITVIDNSHLRFVHLDGDKSLCPAVSPRPVFDCSHAAAAVTVVCNSTENVGYSVGLQGSRISFDV